MMYNSPTIEIFLWVSFVERHDLTESETSTFVWYPTYFTELCYKKVVWNTSVLATRLCSKTDY